MSKFKNLAGLQIGSCKVYKLLKMTKKQQSIWLCICDCGRLFKKRSDDLLKGQTHCSKCGHASHNLESIDKEMKEINFDKLQFKGY
jgi:hypothetical protein